MTLSPKAVQRAIHLWRVTPENAELEIRFTVQYGKPTPLTSGSVQYTHRAAGRKATVRDNVVVGISTCQDSRTRRNKNKARQHAAQQAQQAQEGTMTNATDTRAEDRILEVVRVTPGVTGPDLSALLDVNKPYIRRVLLELTEAGKLQRQGRPTPNPNAAPTYRYYLPTEAPEDEAERYTPAPTRNPGGMDGREEAALKLWHQLATKDHKHLAAAGGYTYPRAQALVTRLQELGMIR